MAVTTHNARVWTAGWLMFTGIAIFLLFYLSRDLRINSSESFQSDDGTVLYIEQQTDLDGLIAHLQALNVEFKTDELRWVSPLLGWRTFNSGRYEIGGEHSYEELLSKVALGLQDHASVLIRPGITPGRLAAELGRQLQADSSDFAAVFSDTSQLVQELDTDPNTLFSRMLPDTYNIFWTTSPERVIRRLNQEFETRVVQRFQENFEENRLTIDEIITLASIIEWEARGSYEMQRISGLYWNRLNSNMRLQADPTVIYALGEHRRLLFEDYQIDHPYNTYRIDGLPPGPITNPSLSSIAAALNPEDHDYLYMVASPEGGHVFSKSFEEHQVASAEWRRWIREQYRIQQERMRELESGDGI